MLRTRLRRFVTAVAITTLGFVGILIFSLNLSLASAGDLPPRPEPTATPQPNKPLKGAALVLQLTGAVTGPQGVWTVIEWQDPHTEEWYVVEGWQGTVETDGSQMWWVSSSDLATGPFRWLIYVEEGGDLMGNSEPFSLPEKNGQKVTIEVDL